MSTSNSLIAQETTRYSQREALKAAYDTLLFYANMDSYNNGAAERIANTADGVPAYKITPAPIMLDDGQKARSLLSAIRAALADGVTETEAPAQGVRDAFKAGWYVNAGTDVEPAAKYLAECEQVDWEVYVSTLRSTDRGGK